MALKKCSLLCQHRSDACRVSITMLRNAIMFVILLLIQGPRSYPDEYAAPWSQHNHLPSSAGGHGDATSVAIAPASTSNSLSGSVRSAEAVVVESAIARVSSADLRAALHGVTHCEVEVSNCYNSVMIS